MGSSQTWDFIVLIGITNRAAELKDPKKFSAVYIGKGQEVFLGRGEYFKLIFNDFCLLA